MPAHKSYQFLTTWNLKIVLNLFNYFKFKFTQDHHSTSSMKYVIPCSKINSDNIKINEQDYINMIVVSIYYYNRYNNIDNYLDSENMVEEVRESDQ